MWLAVLKNVHYVNPSFMTTLFYIFLTGLSESRVNIALHKSGWVKDDSGLQQYPPPMKVTDGDDNHYTGFFFPRPPSFVVGIDLGDTFTVKSPVLILVSMSYGCKS